MTFDQLDIFLDAEESKVGGYFKSFKLLNFYKHTVTLVQILMRLSGLNYLKR